ncbi:MULTISPECIES: sigma-70 family RNA polymerase sigma factor [unclassified Streptomyces]|uniref:sigma-70 family RNA polymerase sigma factor n=1 Tax=unclassified Streptomyces TaxID=2593676 RepID=UPI000DAB92EC|nr:MULTISPECIES: sigma-70 family RNA polymerase sigma factor [unclassified Streptomyces]PZT73710.1 RNA polymerase [Streptomyces sp. AC1-42T]PZT83296.1 RNA polymerase [Streptomyces sp. AC1-42W]
MGQDRERALIEAARAGDPGARDQLVTSCLPLLYNVVGRALNGHADVDDVVQETVLRMLRALPGLRDPASFRSWLVAIAMNEIRGHWRDRQTAAIPVEPLAGGQDRVDPGADFVDVTILRLGLSGQRRQVAEATRWVDEDDRALLSLWWLEAAGELSRAEVAAALHLSPEHTAVRVQRMKAQLDTARVVVGALGARPRCVLLDDMLAGWDGAPSPLWRKRIARHARGCTVCSGFGTGLVPAEGLLVGLALVPLAGVAAAGRSPRLTETGAATPLAASARPGRAALRRTQARRRRRNAVVASVLAVGVLGAGGAAVHLSTGDDGDAEVSVAAAPESSAPAATSATAEASATAVPSPSASPSARASASPSATKAEPKASPKKSAPASRRPSATASAPANRPPAPDRSSPGPASEAEQVLALVNTERAREGCGPVTGNAQLTTAAQRHSEDMAARDYFSHTSQDGSGPGDRITATGYRWSTYGENIAKGQRTPAAVMDSWMNSPGHRANILNCSFKELGVGVEDSPGGIVWTQDFGTGR